jgi:hypothetical protein
MTSHCASHILRKPLLEACFDMLHPADTKSVQSIGDPSLPQVSSKQRQKTTRKVKQINKKIYIYKITNDEAKHIMIIPRNYSQIKTAVTHAASW